MSILWSINSGPVKQWSKPIRDRKYREFVRRFPCVCCGEQGKRSRIEAAHFGPHGIASKSGDDTVLPLCYEHHQGGKHAYHNMNPEDFATVHDLDVAALQAMFQRFYFQRTGRRVKPEVPKQEKAA